jgi:hypothetical protein
MFTINVFRALIFYYLIFFYKAQTCTHTNVVCCSKDSDLRKIRAMQHIQARNDFITQEPIYPKSVKPFLKPHILFLYTSF